jgi:hypothetical protein
VFGTQKITCADTIQTVAGRAVVLSGLFVNPAVEIAKISPVLPVAGRCQCVSKPIAGHNCTSFPARSSLCRVVSGKEIFPLNVGHGRSVSKGSIAILGWQAEFRALVVFGYFAGRNHHRQQQKTQEMLKIYFVFHEYVSRIFESFGFNEARFTCSALH